MDGRRRRERGERKRGRSGRETGKLPSLFLPLPLRRLANSPFPPFPLLSRESRRGGEKEREPEKERKGSSSASARERESPCTEPRRRKREQRDLLVKAVSLSPLPPDYHPPPVVETSPARAVGEYSKKQRRRRRRAGWGKWEESSFPHPPFFTVVCECGTI